MKIFSEIKHAIKDVPKHDWISFGYLFAITIVLLCVSICGCGTDNGQETSMDSDGSQQTQDGGTIQADARPDATLSSHDAKADSKKELDAKAFSNPDSGSNLVCYSLGCRYPEQGCCYSRFDHSVCITNASCSESTWQIQGCYCPQNQ